MIEEIIKQNPIVALQGVASALCYYLFIKRMMVLRKKIDFYNKLKKLEVFSPQQLLNLNESSSVKKLVFVLGRFVSPNPIFSKLWDSLELIFREEQIYKLFSVKGYELVRCNQFWAKSLRIVELTNDSFIELIRTTGTKLLFEKSYLGCSNQIIELNRIQNIIKFFYHLFSIFTKRTFFQGFYIKKKICEFGIQNKEPLTILGNLISSGSNKLLEPLYIVHNKEQLLKSIAYKIRGLKYQGIFLHIFAILFISRLGQNFYKLYQQNKQAAKRRLSDKKFDDKKLEIKDLRCVVCYAKLCNIILKPCKHYCLCRECYGRLLSNKCPLCNTKISDFTEVFLS
ncbi:hypothetical protein pb186bvf_005738 [Paramecium bursaria]